MKKALIAYYVQLALAMGIPLTGITAFVTMFGENIEDYIVETTSYQDESEESGSEETTSASSADDTETSEAFESYNVKYTYDLLGRLIQVEYEPYIIEYVYDSNGNILEVNKTLK